jgi:hypothetical protein
MRFVWQAILPAGGLSGRRAGWKARLQPGLAATQQRLRLNSISPTAKLARDDIRRSEIGLRACQEMTLPLVAARKRSLPIPSRDRRKRFLQACDARPASGHDVPKIESTY